MNGCSYNLTFAS